MKIKKIVSSYILTAILFFSPALLWAATLIAPQVTLQESQEFPGFGTEALHIARFTIQADGTTSDIDVVGGFTNSFARQFVTDIVKDWTYTPGTQNGEPVDFYNQQFILRARLFDELVITPSIQEGIDDIRALVEKGNYQRPQRIINRLLANDIRSVSDFALLHEVKASIYMAMEDNFAALYSSQKSTISTINLEQEVEFMLMPDVLESALRKQVILAASVGQNAVVMRSFTLLENNFEIAADDSIMQTVNAARTALESPEPLGLLAKIVEDKWTYELARRVFTVTAVDGKIRKIDVRCERRNLELDFEEDVEWTLPESFGKCQLDFIGRDDTQFTVYEFM